MGTEVRRSKAVEVFAIMLIYSLQTCSERILECPTDNSTKESATGSQSDAPIDSETTLLFVTIAERTGR